MTASEHRARARAALRGNWVMAALTTLVMVVATLGVSLVGSFLTVIPLLGLVVSMGIAAVSGVFSLGYSQYALNLVDHKPAELKDVFSRFDLLKTYLKVFLLEFAIMLVPGLVVLLVGSILTALLDGLGGLVMMAGVIAWYVFLIMFAFGISQVFFILLENPDMGAREAMRRSWDLMNGNKFRFFCLNFSFIGWGFLVAFTFGLGSFVLSPYMYVSMASFYRELVPGVVSRKPNEDPIDPQPYEEPASDSNYVYNALPEAVVNDDAPKSSMDDAANDATSTDSTDDGAAVMTPSW